MYMNNGVALPKAEFCATWDKVAEWKNLPKDEFMTKFGNATLALYCIPTQAELDQLEEYDVDEALNGDNGDNDDDNMDGNE